MTHYQQFVLSQMAMFAIPAGAAFPIYYWASTAGAAERLKTSAHGLWLLIAAAYAILVAPYSAGAFFAWLAPFWILLLVFLVSLIYGIWGFAGNRWVHLFLLVEIPCAFFVWLVGSMAISHDWL